MPDLATARANFEKLRANVATYDAIPPDERTPRQTAALLTDAVTGITDAHATFEAIAAIVAVPVAAPTATTTAGTPVSINGVEWASNPWPEPTSASVEAILEANGVTVTGGQYTVPPDLVSRLSTADNQILSAGGVFNSPLDPIAGADYSQYSGVDSKSPAPSGMEFVTVAYRNGAVLGQEETHTQPEQVAFWHQFAGA